jgi:hypothetical protein
MKALVLLSFCAVVVLGDFLGPIFPAPFDLASKTSHVATAWSNATSTLLHYINDKSTNASSPSGLKNITFSAGLFSLHDPAAATALQFHHTSPDIAKSKVGVKKVDGNRLVTLFSWRNSLSSS